MLLARMLLATDNCQESENRSHSEFLPGRLTTLQQKATQEHMSRTNDTSWVRKKGHKVEWVGQQNEFGSSWRRRTDMIKIDCRKLKN